MEAITITDIINKYVSTHSSFTTTEFSEMLRTEFPKIGRSTIYKILKDLCDDKRIFHIGRGSYAVNNARTSYTYELSDSAKELATAIIDNFPLVDFQIWELFQMNEFVNLLFAHNTIFIDVESMAEEFVFNLLFGKYPHVLLNPSLEEYYRYAGDETIVIGRLVTEAPPCYGQYRQAPIEKLLVDLFGRGLSGSIVARSEYPAIYEDSFKKYNINQAKMFRYARRRGTEKSIREFIRQETDIHTEKES